MATKVSGVVKIENDTPTLIYAADGSLRSFVVRVLYGEVWFGPDNTVAPDDGLYWTNKDEPLVDDVPSVDDWYATTRDGRRCTISYMAITDA